jgi:hypothetical protein
MTKLHIGKIEFFGIIVDLVLVTYVVSLSLKLL